MISPQEATLYGAIIAAVAGLVGAGLGHIFKRREALPGIEAQFRDQLMAAQKQLTEGEERLRQRLDAADRRGEQADLIIAGWRGRFEEQYTAHQALLLKYDEQERRCAEVRDQLNDAAAELVQANVELHEAREALKVTMGEMAALQAELEAERRVRESLEALKQVKAQN